MTFFGTWVRLAGTAGVAALALAPLPATAGAQAEEYLAPSVATLLTNAISDRPVPPDWGRQAAVRPWLDEMSRRLAPRIPDTASREDFLATVHYEATRAGLDPSLVMGVIEVESAFHKYAISPVGARGYMQVMPFWIALIGSGGNHNLFHLRTNLRYGCVILRHYLDTETGDYYRALGRYNGSLGSPGYPSSVMAAVSRNWQYASSPTKLGAAATLTSLR